MLCESIVKKWPSIWRDPSRLKGFSDSLCQVPEMMPVLMQVPYDSGGPVLEEKGLVNADATEDGAMMKRSLIDDLIRGIKGPRTPVDEVREHIRKRSRARYEANP